MGGCELHSDGSIIFTTVSLQSAILNANISETDLANFVSMLNHSLWTTPPTSGDLPLLQDLLNRSVAVFENVQSREVAHTISQVFVCYKLCILQNSFLGYCVVTKCAV